VIVGIMVALAAALTLALLLGLVFESFRTHNGPTGIDVTAFRWFTARRTPSWTPVMRRVTYLGSGFVVLPVTVVAATVLAVAGRRRLGLAVVVTVAGAALVNWIAKAVIGRDGPLAAIRPQRPHASSFPSGHSVQAAATFVALGIVVASLTRVRIVRTSAWTVLAVVVVAVGVSRLYLGVHWATDVFAGWLVGTVCAVGVAVAFGILRRRRPGDAPSPPRRGP
jgi:undecaprenyl-diphosphatase